MHPTDRERRNIVTEQEQNQQQMGNLGGATPPPPPPPPPAEEAATQAGISKDDTTWGVIVHLAAIVGLLGVPFGNLLGPLVVWLIKRAESPFVDYHGKEALNFQITMTIAALVAIPLCLILIGFVLLFAIFVVEVVFLIMAAMSASKGEYYRYPISIRLVK